MSLSLCRALPVMLFALFVLVDHSEAAFLKPGSLTSTAVSNSQINLSWVDNSSDELGFKVVRATSSAGPWVQIGITGPNVTSYSNSNVSASTTFYYRVRAYRGGSHTSYSNTASATTGTGGGGGADTTAPSRPTGLTATAVSCSQHNLAWAASTDNAGGSGLKGYNVYKGGNFLKQVLGPATSTSDSGLPPSTTFSYVVSAVDNANNESAQSIAAAATTPSCPPTQTSWSDAFGNSQDDRARSVALDQSGNIVMTGDFRQTVNFGGGNLVPTIYCLLGICNPGYPSDIVLAKFSPAGAHLWSKRIGGHGDDWGTAVAVDRDGDVLVTGTVGPNVDFGGGELPCPGGYDIFVAKYSGADGGYRWAQRLGGEGSDVFSYAIAVDDQGDVVIIGQFAGTVDLGSGPLTSVGDWDIFVAKYAGIDGRPLWSRRMGGTQDSNGLGVAVDSLGNVVVTGYFYGVADFGGPAPLTAADRDIFLAKYRGSDGAYLWAKQIGSTAYDHGSGVAVDSSDNILLTGAFTGTVNFGGPSSLSTPNAGSDAFVAKYTSSGGYMWAQRFGGSNGDWGTSIAADGNNNVVVTGHFQGTVDFGNGPLTSAGSFDIFVLKLAPTGGTPLWSRRYGSAASDERSLGLAAGLDGAVAVSGYFTTAVNFGDGLLHSAGSMDMFLLHIGP